MQKDVTNDVRANLSGQWPKVIVAGSCTNDTFSNLSVRRKLHFRKCPRTLVPERCFRKSQKSVLESPRTSVPEEG
jgi:hypothetical protein